MALAKLKQVLRKAQERGQVVDPAIFGLSTPPVIERRPRFLHWHEVEHLAAWCAEPELVMFSALTGMRQGELFALRADRVRLDEGSVIVDASAYKGRLAPTKTRKGQRRVYLSRLAAEILEDHLRGRRWSSLDLVFASPTGLIWRADNFRNRVFYPARKRAGFDDLTFHDLRHTCASLMIEAGANPLEIAEQLGHMDAHLVFKRYGHLYPGAPLRAVQLLDDLVDRATSVGQSRDAASVSSADEGETAANDRWSVPGSNRRPPACKAGALPAELTPLALPV
jgi:integrase